MKGVVFVSLQELVEETFGLAVWEQVITDSGVASEGIYTAAASYPDEEVFALVGALSKIVDMPAETLVKVFGKFMFTKLASGYPVFLEGHKDVLSFLLTIDQVIHVEVRKLDENASLPTITYEEIDDKNLVMLYSSPRKLCHLSEGLIEGAAEHFDKTVTINHPLCMHDGSDHCRLEIHVNE